MRQDAPATLDIGERLAALGREHRLTQYQAIGETMSGWARARLGEFEAGLGELRGAIKAFREAGTTTLLEFYLTALAETELRGGYIDAAKAALDDANAMTERRAEFAWLSGILRAKGDLRVTLAPADMSAAEKFYEQAMASARERDAKSLELQAVLGLARLWRKQGRTKETRELLAPLYGWFTEGFDTPDLVEAKTLLAELG
jgi:predicted ATPase